MPIVAIAVCQGTQNNPAIAQIVPDGTLGGESSIVTPLDALNDRIDGGAIRGGNLFHSFQEFNIDAGRGAFFDNPAAVENILSRVTGGNPSEIFGTLGVLGNANLFLVNPSGIVFGPDARLDVGGSFFASTAGGILFPDGYEFSATNPESGAGTGAPPLLSVNVPIGLQFGANPGGMVNQSVATNDAGEVRGLQVPSGETLALVGGNVTLDGGNVQPRGGRVELGGVAGVGTVGVNADGSLSFPEGVERADVLLGNAADVNVRAGGGGEIAINAGNFQMSGGSILRAGIESGMGAPDAQAGDINIDATQSIALSEASRIFNGVLSADSTGNAGNINVTTESLSATGSSGLINFTDGLGNGGAITVRATDTRLETDSFFQSGVFSDGVGNAGDIDVATGSLEITSLARLNAFTQGTGNAGNVKVRAVDTVSVDGFTANPDGSTFFSGINSSVDAGGIGNAGDVEISANSVSLSNGAFLGSRTLARGDAGKVSIRAETVTFDSGSGVQNQVFQTGVGSSGGIEIVTGSLFIYDGSRLESDTLGQGNAGKIEIRAADTVVLESLLDETTVSAISTGVDSDAVGNSQGIDITTESLILRNASLGTATSGEGNAGLIAIQATEIVSDNAVLGTSTLGRGDAGKITIQATEIVSDNTIVSSFIGPEAMGNSQGIEITTGSLSFSNSFEGITTFTQGEGNAGNISIQATDSVSLDNATIGSFVESRGIADGIGEGGDISIAARTLSLKDTSVLAQTNGEGDAGNISVRVADAVTVTGSLGFSTSVLDEGGGRGGNIEIETGDFFLGDGTSLRTQTEGRGDAGQATIRARNSVTLDGSLISTELRPDAIGNAREVEITTPQLLLTNGARIRATTDSRGDAASVTIRASDSITLDGGSSISTSAFSNAEGDARGIDLRTDRLSLSDGAEITASSETSNSDAGAIEVEADLIRLDESSIDAFTFGGEGNITLDSQVLILENNSEIITEASGNRRGGNITINSGAIAALNNSDINANALAGQGGDISIAAQSIFGTEFRSGVEDTPQSDITATGANRLQDGSVQVNVEVDPTSGLVSLPETPVDAASLLGTDFCSQRRGSEFIYTGRGGIPPQPTDPASPTTVWQDWSLTEIPETPTTAATPVVTMPKSDRLVEAQGWYTNERGQVVLTANPAIVTPHQSGRVPVECGSIAAESID